MGGGQVGGGWWVVGGGWWAVGGGRWVVGGRCSAYLLQRVDGVVGDTTHGIESLEEGRLV